jgi:RHS repeat-associated protein
MQLRTILRVALPIIIALILIPFFLKGSFANAQENITETTYYFLTDHLGSVDVVLDEEGNVVERADYLPYGSDRLRVTETTAPETDYKFTGKEMDEESGLYYYGARYYDPLLARFVSRDPWEGDLMNPQTLNKYSYAGNNPIFYVDPTGMYVIESGEVEEGDNLTTVTSDLNKFYNTNYSVNDIAVFNNIDNPDLIYSGQIVRIGAYDNDGSTWLLSNSSNAISSNWDNMSKEQQRLSSLSRNFFQPDFSSLPQNTNQTKSSEWDNIGEAIAHNIGTSGNVDYRGKGVRIGQQAIYNSSGNLVTSPENMGTFDFVSPIKDILGHARADLRSWLWWGNGNGDTSTRAERTEILKENWIGRAALVYFSYLKSQGR